MRGKELFEKSISRRVVLRAGAYGICAFCLTGIAGCMLQESEKPVAPEDLKTGAQKGFLGEARSPWFEELDGNLIRCTLCPEKCELKEGERAPCRVRENRNGKGYTLVYGNPAMVQEDPVERKPYFHVLPGSRALSISTAGCNLTCKFCEVWDMALANPEDVYAYNMPPEDIIRQAELAGVKSVSFAFGEPVVFYEYMEKVAALAKEAGLLNLMHTAGYINPAPLKAIAGQMDAVNFDLKGFSPEFYRQYVGGEMEPVLKSLKILREAGVHLEITNIVIPTLNDDQEKIGAMCRWIVKELGPDVPLHFARFYPLYQLSSLPRTPVSTLEQSRKTALESGLKFVYVAKVTGHEGENTYCPQCGESIIDRMGFVIEELRIANGRCSYCEAEIPGIWH